MALPSYGCFKIDGPPMIKNDFSRYKKLKSIPIYPDAIGFLKEKDFFQETKNSKKKKEPSAASFFIYQNLHVEFFFPNATVPTDKFLQPTCVLEFEREERKKKRRGKGEERSFDLFLSLHGSRSEKLKKVLRTQATAMSLLFGGGFRLASFS